MKTYEIMDGIIHRVGKQVITNHGAKWLIDKINERYHFYNHRFKGAVASQLVITFDEDETDFSYDLPDDFLEPYKIDPLVYWRNPKVFDPQENDTYTIDKGKIYFVSAAGEEITIDYWSRGKTLVDDVDANVYPAVSDSPNINEPEWEDPELHYLLVLSVALRLGIKYEGMEIDVVDMKEYERLLKLKRKSQTSASPILSGPRLKRTWLPNDAYGWD